VLLGFGWFLSGGDAPDYPATDEDCTDWADDNRLRSGIGAFLILLAGIAFLHFAATIRSVLGGAETLNGISHVEPVRDAMAPLGCVFAWISLRCRRRWA
jgi:hypothetical protein